MGTIISVLNPTGNLGGVSTGASVSGTVNKTAATLLIKANTIDPQTLGSTLEIRGRMFKTGVAGNCTMRMYFNTTADLNGTPVLLATHTASAANIHAQFVRQVYIDKDSTIVLNSSQNANTDDIENAAGRTVITNSGNINYSANLYLVLALQHGSAADSSTSVVWYTKTHGY